MIYARSTGADVPGVDYDGLLFRPAVAGGGQASATGRYHQDGDLVWAEYSGAGVSAGRLVGTCRPDGTIHAAYCQVSRDGEVVAGSCVSVPSTLPDGRVRLEERWHRMDGSSGVSYVEEVRE
jgi:hypothetical protein